MNRKNRSYQMLSTVMALTIATTAVAPVANAAHFTDIKGYKYENEIYSLVSKGIVKGYPDRTYKPNKTLTRSDVIKLLGKYLTSKGYRVPTDYNSKMRFRDLTSSSDEELLKYAAVVYDNRIFVGANGYLNANNSMTLEQLAIVLVRAKSMLDNYDYIRYVETQMYMQEYLDIEKATAEAQRSINVLDYYDISTDDHFRPKSKATRGEFAGLLYGILNVKSPDKTSGKATVTAVNVLSETDLDVTLSNGKTYRVQLDEPLPENTKVDATFEINGVSYTYKVEYIVDTLKIMNVESVNEGQIVIHFSEPVELETMSKNTELMKYFKLEKVDELGENKSNVLLSRGELSKDGRSYTLTINSLTIEPSYRLRVFNIYSSQGRKLSTYNEVIHLNGDTTPPAIQSVEQISKNRSKVMFTEPVRNYTARFKLADGSVVTGITSSVKGNAITYNLEKARANGELVPDGSEITVTYNGIRDVSGNVSKPYVLTAKIVKGESSSLQVIAVQQMSERKFSITFNHTLWSLAPSDLLVTAGGTGFFVQSVEHDGYSKTYIVTVNSPLSGDVTISTAPNRYVTDEETWEDVTFSVTHNFDTQTASAKIMNSEVLRDNNLEYLFIEFDRNVIVSENTTTSISGTYSANGRKQPIEKQDVKVYSVYGKPQMVKVPLRELLKHTDIENTTYDVTMSFKNLMGQYGGTLANSEVSFTRGKDYSFNGDKLQVVAVKTSLTDSSIKDPSIITIDFNYPVDEAVASNLENYEIRGYNLGQVQVNPSNSKQVILKIESQWSYSVTPYLYITDLRAENSFEEMDSYYELISLPPVVAPGQSYWNPSLSVKSSREVVLTFGQAITIPDEDAFFVTDSSGTSYSAKASIDPNNSKNVILTLDKTMPRYTTMTVELKGNRILRDVYNNPGRFDPKTVYVPYYYY
ncbi:S-layer homology domain-containing protein [Lysinibacillus sp. KU-BSD001]|uniref:S-layer homology domain-containing protein n=1 Tax=Lysinibacillus sp. KU-BSD001 TaxID=3141328 RepID=UPI0036ED306B